MFNDFHRATSAKLREEDVRLIQRSERQCQRIATLLARARKLRAFLANVRNRFPSRRLAGECEIPASATSA